MIEFQTLVFYLFAILIVLSAIGVILSPNPIYSALCLVLAFVSSAGVWMLLHAEFLAITLVLVYVGAVMVLFLFVLMMLDVNFNRLKEGLWRYLPLALLISALLVWEMSVILGDETFIASMGSPAESTASNTRALGAVLYTQYVYPFELASVVLLVAIIAAVTLTLRHRKGTKYSDPAQQSRVSASRRVRLLTMDSSEQTKSYIFSNGEKDGNI